MKNTNALSDNTKGKMYAGMAAALNGTIGIFSKYLISLSLSPATIAFLKSVIGFICLLALVPGRIESWAAYWRTGICAFFGIFMLFYFETVAYHHELAANVVLTLMATAAIAAFLLGWLLIGDKPTTARWVGLSICTVGLAVFLGVSRPSNATGLLLAALAGAGYGAFSVIAKRLGVGGGLAVTRRLLMFGAAYLAVPFFWEPITLPGFSVATWVCLTMLALLPSIGGLYCTTRAIELVTPGQVQLFELLEPLFAAALALLVLQEIPTLNTLVGGLLVVVGLFVSQRDWWSKEANSKPSATS